MHKNIIYSAVLLVALGLGLWLVWKLVIGEWVVEEYLFDPSRSSGEAFTQERDIAWIRDGIGYTILIYWGGAVLAVLAWLFLSNRISLHNPGAHGRPRWIWFAIFVAGAMAVVGCGVLDLFSISGVMLPGWGDNLAVLFLLLYFVAYWPIGSWGFTRPALLPAVPLATLVR